MGSVLARPWSRSGESGEFTVEFASASEGQVRVGLAECAQLAVERFDPVRSFPSYRGQRGFVGWWWFATTGRHVGHESWLEREHLIVWDSDPDVVDVACQPFWLRWSEGNRARRHAPDYFVRRTDGSGLVVDVRADDRIEPEDAAAFAASERACRSVGWDYRRVGALDSVLAANMRWLAGYRHPRCLRPAVAALLERMVTAPVELGRAVDAVGDPIVVLPTLFHLLWSRRLTADLAGVVLSRSTLVGPA